MDEHPPEAWQRLGKALELRRWQLGYGHGQRGRFARARGWALSDKVLARLEQGAQPGYPDSTLARAEDLYGLRPGSIKAFLDGGEFTPADTSSRTIGDLTEDEERSLRAVLEVQRSLGPDQPAPRRLKPAAAPDAGRPASLRYADKAKDAIAAKVWERNQRDPEDPIFKTDEELRGVVDYLWNIRKQQEAPAPRARNRRQAAG